MIDDLRRRVLNHGSGRLHVLIEARYTQASSLPGFPQGTALHHMQRMQLDAIGSGAHHLLQRSQTIHGHLPRQADNQMRTNLEASGMGADHCILIGPVAMAAIDALQGFLVGALQSKLQPDLESLLPVTGQQIKHSIRNTVRTGPHTQAHDIRDTEGLTYI